MKKISILVCSLMLCGSVAMAQSRGAELFNRAQTSLEAKEYTEARYSYLQAFNAFAAEKNYAKAAEAAVKVAELYHRENYYKEAFELLNRADADLLEVQRNGGNMTSSLYATSKERMNMYVKLKNPDKAKDFLNRMEEYAKLDKSLTNDFLLTQATFYYTFGQPQLGDSAINRLIDSAQDAGDYKKADKCYKQLIAEATRSNNAKLVARTYERYNAWVDSVRLVTAADELSAMTAKFNDSELEKAAAEHSLAVKNGIIVALGVVVAVLVAAIVLGIAMILRLLARNRRQKKNIMIANEHNDLKTKFIQNISAQMEPTLNTLDQNLLAVKALKSFSSHIQQLAELENTLSQRYEMTDNNVVAFCEKVVDNAKPDMKPGIEVTITAPKVSAKFNAEEAEDILHHLLVNASLHSSDGGKVNLEFRKRGAHSVQFIVTDAGTGVAPERVATLFKPFSEVRDLTKGDWLGLPIRALKATKMNGSLSYDSTYSLGARFILEIHDK